MGTAHRRGAAARPQHHSPQHHDVRGVAFVPWLSSRVQWLRDLEPHRCPPCPPSRLDAAITCWCPTLASWSSRTSTQREWTTLAKRPSAWASSEVAVVARTKLSYERSSARHLASAFGERARAGCGCGVHHLLCVCVCVRVRVCVCLCGCACVCVGVWVCRDTPVVAAGSNLPFLAPEILMGCRWHSQAADIWAVGCVLAHLHLGKPLLAGKDVRHHLLHIFKVCGSPAIAYVAVLVCVRVRGVLLC